MRISREEKEILVSEVSRKNHPMPNPPTPWKTIFPLATKIQKMTPWNWMDETEIFGVHIPGTQRTYFISVMGSAGIIYAISAYKGTFGLSQFWQLQESADGEAPETVLTIPQVMISFEKKNMLSAEIIHMHKEHDVKPLSGLWPVIEQYIPGFAPCEPDEETLYDTAIILEQTLDVLKRAEVDADFILPEENDESTYLIRERDNTTKETIWKDKYVKVEFPTVEFNIKYSAELFFQVYSLPQKPTIIQLDLIMLPSGVKEEGYKAFFPFILLMVNKKSEMIEGYQMITPIPDLHSMYESLAEEVLEMILALGYSPQKIEIRKSILEATVLPVLEKARIKTIMVNSLKSLDKAAATVLSAAK